MAAYIIIEAQITDPVAYQQYKNLTPASLEEYRGKFIVHGGATKTLEGTWQPKRIVILEFPDMEHAKQWWHSPEYTAARKIRENAAIVNMIMTEGL